MSTSLIQSIALLSTGIAIGVMLQAIRKYSRCDLFGHRLIAVEGKFAQGWRQLFICYRCSYDKMKCSDGEPVGHGLMIRRVVE